MRVLLSPSSERFQAFHIFFTLYSFMARRLTFKTPAKTALNTNDGVPVLVTRLFFHFCYVGAMGTRLLVGFHVSVSQEPAVLFQYLLLFMQVK